MHGPNAEEEHPRQRRWADSKLSGPVVRGLGSCRRGCQRCQRRRAPCPSCSMRVGTGRTRGPGREGEGSVKDATRHVAAAEMKTARAPPRETAPKGAGREPPPLEASPPRGHPSRARGGLAARGGQKHGMSRARARRRSGGNTEVPTSTWRAETGMARALWEKPLRGRPAFGPLAGRGC